MTEFTKSLKNLNTNSSLTILTKLKPRSNMAEDLLIQANGNVFIELKEVKKTMRKLRIKAVCASSKSVSFGGGRHWDNLCGTRD